MQSSNGDGVDDSIMLYAKLAIHVAVHVSKIRRFTSRACLTFLIKTMVYSIGSAAEADFHCQNLRSGSESGSDVN